MGVQGVKHCPALTMHVGFFSGKAPADFLGGEGNASPLLGCVWYIWTGDWRRKREREGQKYVCIYGLKEVTDLVRAGCL